MNLKELRQFCTTDRENEILEAKILKGTDKDAANAIGTVTRQTVNSTMARIKKRAVARGYSPDHDMTKTAPDGFGVKGVSTLYDEDGNVKSQWVKTQASKEEQAHQLVRLVDSLTQDIKPVSAILPPDSCLSDSLTVYPFGDPHVGVATFFSETGEDYTLDKAEMLFTAAMARAVDKAPPTEEALVVNVGDYFHSDNAQNQTRRSGNPLDTSGAFIDRLEIGTRIMVNIIDLALRKHKKVTVINTIGNHDEHMSMALSCILGTFYRNEPRVYIPVTKTAYQYHRFGKNLIGITHGDQCKPSDLEGIMASDRAEDWGQTRHRYWYTGHIHHDVVKEFRGCKFEAFRTLAPKDGWHSNKGYRSDRDMKVLVLHKDFGEVDRYTINITQFADIFEEYAA